MESEAKDTSLDIKRNFMKAIVCKEMAMPKTVQISS